MFITFFNLFNLNDNKLTAWLNFEQNMVTANAQVIAVMINQFFTQGTTGQFSSVVATAPTALCTLKQMVKVKLN